MNEQLVKVSALASDTYFQKFKLSRFNFKNLNRVSIQILKVKPRIFKLLKIRVTAKG